MNFLVVIIKMEAIVLAGGFGTRLSHIVSDVPKPMAQVNNEPFLKHIFKFLRRNKINKVVLATGYKSEAIEEYFKVNYHGIEIIYSIEDEPLGTGGAIKKAMDYCKDEDIFIINGDTYFDVNLNEMNIFHNKKNSDLTVATKQMNDFERYGNVIFDIDDKILDFQEKSLIKNGNINGGIYLLSKKILNKMIENKFSFEKEFMELMVKENNFYSFKSKGYFIDIGVPEDYYKAQTDFKTFDGNKNKAVFLDRDGTINSDNGYTHKIEDLRFIDGIQDLIKKYNSEGYKVIVITNQAGIAKGYYTINDMHKFHDYMDKQLVKCGAHIDAYYYCPHHPDINGECNCRKPNTGMIEDAIEDFNIDVSKSVLLGDKLTDLEAGEKCGLKNFFINDIFKLK